MTPDAPYDDTWLAASPFLAEVDVLTREQWEWIEMNPLQGFRGFLISKFVHLNNEERIQLFSIFNTYGWPLHLQTWESAHQALLPGSPWHPADDLPLMVARDARLSYDDIARVLYEGRTASDLEARWNYLRTTGALNESRAKYIPGLGNQGASVQDSGDAPLQASDASDSLKDQEPRLQHNRNHSVASSSAYVDAPETPTPINKQPEPQSKKSQEKLAFLMDTSTDNELTSPGSAFSIFEDPTTPAPTPKTARKAPLADEKKLSGRLSKTPTKRRASATPKPHHSSKRQVKWTDEEFQMLSEGVAKGMSPAEIRETYLSSRTLAAVETKINACGRQGTIPRPPTLRSWTKKERQDLIHLAEEGHTWEYIATNRFPKRTPAQCKDLHQLLIARQPSSVTDHQHDAREESEQPADHQQEDVEMSGVGGTESPVETLSKEPTPTPSHDAAFDDQASNPPAESPESIQKYRDQAVDAMLLEDSAEIKQQFKDALDNSSWPDHLATVEAYHAETKRSKLRWSDGDIAALRCILKLPLIPITKLLVANFFPNRAAEGVKKKLREIGRQEEHLPVCGADEGADHDEEMEDLTLV